MNILVTGANGQLGKSVRRVTANSEDRYIFTDVAELDITDKEAVRNIVKKENIEVIINCAAFTDVEGAEDKKDLAERLNAEAVRNLGEATAENDGTLIHISTDYVFGGNQGNTPRGEDEPVNPTGVYGLTKLHGEEQIKSSGAKALIFRTAWLYSEYGKNFLKTMMRLTNTVPTLKVVFDQAGTPTYAGDLAEAIVKIIEERKFKGNEGIYHYSNEGVCSWFDFTKRIAQETGTDRKCDIEPCHSDEFPSKVTRPSYSVLDKSKFKKTFGLKIPYWTDSLSRCICNLAREGAGV